MKLTAIVQSSPLSQQIVQERGEGHAICEK